MLMQFLLYIGDATALLLSTMVKTFIFCFYMNTTQPQQCSLMVWSKRELKSILGCNVQVQFVFTLFFQSISSCCVIIRGYRSMLSSNMLAIDLNTLQRVNVVTRCSILMPERSLLTFNILIYNMIGLEGWRQFNLQLIWTTFVS